MTAWQAAALSDLLADVRSGFACGVDPPGGVFQFRMNNITMEGQLDFSKKRRVPRDTHNLDSFLLQPGDVLFNATNSPELVGKSAFFAGHDEPAVFSNHFLRLRPRKDQLDGRFLARWLVVQFQRGVFEGLCRQWVNQATVSRDSLLALRLPVPPLPKQHRIAEVLDRAEALRAQRRAALAQLDALTQSIFLDMFGDPITNPKRWPAAAFGRICERVTVGIVVRPASYYVASGVPALRAVNIRPGKIVLEDLVYFSQEDNETKLAKTKLKAGDVVLVRSGQPGTAAVIPPELHGVNAIDLLIATPSYKLGDSSFLCAFFNSAGGRDLVVSRQRGQVQKHLNVGSLNQAIIPCPPMELQHDFALRAAAVEKLKATHRVSLAELDVLFASLQHRAFRGEL